MDVFTGFHLNLWERLGFKFDTSSPYEGRVLMKASKQFEQFEFGLQISNSMAIVSTLNLDTLAYEHHVMSEAEAVEWFSNYSKEFTQLYLQTSQLSR